MKIKKILTKTPLISIIFFIGYIIFFSYLINHYYVDKYEIIDTEIIQVLTEEPVIIIKNTSMNKLYENQPVQLVYSSQEQVLSGYVLGINEREVYLYVEKVHSLTDKEIRAAIVKIFDGKEPIRSCLGI